MWRNVIAGATISLGVCQAGAAGMPSHPGIAGSAPAAMPERPARLALGGQRTSVPGLQRTEAGLTWALGTHVAVQLSYVRTANAPLMRGDHQDGVVTHLRFGF